MTTNIESILELAEILSQQNDFTEILRIVTAKTSIILQSDITTIKMLNPRTEDTCKTIFNKEKESNKERYNFFQSYLIGLAIKINKSVLIKDITENNLFQSGVDNLKSAICVPIIFGGVAKGYLLVLRNSNKNSFDEKDLKYLEQLALISAPHICNTQKIQEFFNLPITQNVLLNKYKSLGLFGKSNSFIELLQSIEAASKCDVRVVLEGETGTGKELIVKAIHNFSARSGFPFIAIDCGAIANNLIESELFGHVKGAFTGANQDHTGLIVKANKGTLFLDEICNLSFEMQSKLLRVLQEGEVRPVGSTKIINVDVRFIAASSIPLQTLVEKKEFREDLFFRLMVYPIKVPTLNERKADIPLMANHFMQKFSKKQNKKAEFFHKDILNYMKNKNWTGNIRELENFVERIVTVIPEGIESIDVSLLPEKLKVEIILFKESFLQRKIISLTNEVENYEKIIIEKSLDENEWNQSQTARELDIPEQTLRYKMKKLGIERNKLS